jgi:hypothetical protein
VAGLEPNYSTQASAALDMLESGTDDRLPNAERDAIDLICDHPGGRGPSGCGRDARNGLLTCDVGLKMQGSRGRHLI